MRGTSLSTSRLLPTAFFLQLGRWGCGVVVASVADAFSGSVARGLPRVITVGVTISVEVMRKTM